MDTVCQKNMCAGCMLCQEICPKSAIRIIDSIENYNAIIDDELCIQCNKCHKTCPQNQPPKMWKPIECLEGWANEETRNSSSSGGFAAAIGKAFVRNGGIVYSCSFSKGMFCFSCANQEDEIDKFKGSKYIKSSPGKIYKEIFEKIKAKKNVLFIGLPCQVAACINYIGESDYLYTIDLICHGTPSPRVLDLFLKDYGIQTCELEEITFRKKNNFSLESKKSFSVPIVCDYYSMIFLDGTSYTINCYECKYARQERISDITLGDSWGSQLPQSEKQNGVSLALVQNEKGMRLLKNADLHLFKADLERAVQANRQLRHPSIAPLHRALFFRELKKGKKYRSVIFRCYPSRYIKDRIKTILYHLGIVGESNNEIQYRLEISLNDRKSFMEEYMR